MNDNIEQLLQQLTPRGVRAELRPQVLAAVASRLQANRESRRFRWAALVVAASIAAGIALNIELSRMSDRRLAQLYGPPPLSKQAMEIAQFVGKATDAETAEWVYRRLTPPGHSSGDGLAAYARYCAMLERLFNESGNVLKEPRNETSEKDSEMDRDRTGRAGGDPLNGQRVVRLDHRYTA